MSKKSEIQNIVYDNEALKIFRFILSVLMLLALFFMVFIVVNIDKIK